MKDSKPEKKQVDGFKVIGIGCLIFFAVLYLLIILFFPFYGRNRYTYKTEEKLVNLLDKRASHLVYPEELTADFQDGSYQVILDGPTNLAKPEGYEVSGNLKIADWECNVIIICEKMDYDWKPALPGLTYRDTVSSLEESKTGWALATRFGDNVYRMRVSLQGEMVADLQERLRTEVHGMWYQIIDENLANQK